MTEIIVAIISATVGGLGVAWVKGWFMNKDQLRKELKHELRQLKEDLNLIDEKVDLWKEKYYKMLLKYIEMKKAYGEMETKFKSLEMYLQETRDRCPNCVERKEGS